MKTFKEMEESFYKEVRLELINGLALCPESQRHLFKLLYAHKNLEWPIEKVVENMDNDKLDWAMQQVYRGLKSVR